MANFIPDLNMIRDGVNFLADYIRKALEAIQAKVEQIEFGDIFGSRINWAGSPVLPSEIIPWDAAPAGAGAQFINCLDIYRDGVAQYRDDDSLFFGPGHILHRGLFKRQECNDDGTWVSAIAASLTIPDECPVSEGTTTGLAAETWYYVYWKLDAAGTGPEYRISKTPPVRCPGYGPEHPVYEKLRFVGSFRTLAAPDAFIRPFNRHANGWVFWREVVVGPKAPTYDRAVDSAVFMDVDLSFDVPPTADCVHYTTSDHSTNAYTRVKGDVVDPSGYNAGDNSDAPGYFLPINVIDDATSMPRTDSLIQQFNNNSEDTLGVAAYHEALL